MSGISLAEKVHTSPHERLDAETAFGGMISLLTELKEQHSEENWGYDIHPENIVVTADNHFLLRDISIDRLAVSLLDADGFTPPEWLDPAAEPGPWSDLYSVAALLYFCVTGQKPTSAYERLLGEKLVMPSEMNIPIDSAPEAILKKGLKIQAAERYQNADSMIAAIEQIYPSEDSTKQSGFLKRNLFITLTTITFLLLMTASFIYFHPGILVFCGRETETIWIEPEKDASEKVLEKDWRILRKRAETLAGNEGYFWRKEGRNVRLMLPESLFSERGSRAMIGYYLTDNWKLISGKDESGQTHIITLSEAEIVNQTMPGLKEFVTYENRLRSSQRNMDSLKTGAYIRVRLNSKDRAALESGFKRFQKSIHPAVSGENAAARGIVRANMTWLIKDSAFYKEDRAYFERRYDGIDSNLLAVHLNDDPSCLDVTSQMQSQPFAHLLAYNITHEGPKHHFYAVTEQKAKWDNPKRAGYRGQYQKGSDANMQNPVYLTYLTTYGAALPEGNPDEWKRKVIDFKKQLDRRKVPYVIGVSRDNAREILIEIDRTKISISDAKKLDQDSSYRYELIGIQDVDSSGRPVSEQKGYENGQ